MANPIFGYSSPFSSFVDPRRNQLMGMAAGLAGGGIGGMWQGGMQGSQLDMQAFDRRQEQEDRNSTIDYIKAQYPQFAALPPDRAFQLAMAEEARKNSGAGQETFFGTPVPFQTEQGIQYGQLGNQGTFRPVQLPDGATFAPRTNEIDLGNYISVQDQHGNELYRMPKSGSVPTGYQHTPEGGGVMPMPGSEPAREMQAVQVQATSAMNSLETKNQIAVNAIDSALQQASGWNTGNVMGNSGWVPGLGQSATDLSKVLDTIKANIGFEELQTMRDNSPTGGALGQVTERELAFLQSTIANIEQSQSEAQLRQNLQILRNFLLQSQEQRRRAFQQQYGAGAQMAPAPQSTGGGYTVLGVE